MVQALPKDGAASSNSITNGLYEARHADHEAIEHLRIRENRFPKVLRAAIYYAAAEQSGAVVALQYLAGFLYIISWPARHPE